MVRRTRTLVPQSFAFFLVLIVIYYWFYAERETTGSSMEPHSTIEDGGSLKIWDAEEEASPVQQDGTKRIGDNGTASFLPDDSDMSIRDGLYNLHKYNAFLSDFIPLDRRPADFRPPSCKSKMYRSQLPPVSIIIAFHNEHWSVLLRTITSILLRTPWELLLEIILVDDGSDLDFYVDGMLREILNESAWWEDVTVYRLESHVGIVSARLAGIEQASGPVYVILDAHTEIGYNWLPPLLQPMLGNYREIGGYDRFMKGWGGEQFDISLKTWLCGGKIIVSECSRVSHIYRPNPLKKTREDSLRNSKRVIEVWFDEPYKQAVYSRRPELFNIYTGDLAQGRETKKQLKCKPLEWFFRRIAPDLKKSYPAWIKNWQIPPGAIIHKASGLCLSASRHKRVILKVCSSTFWKQKFIHSQKGNIMSWGYRYEDHCVVGMEQPGSEIHIVIYRGNGSSIMIMEYNRLTNDAWQNLLVA